ncbi:MAG: STAS domain-containing protein [Massilia sp.]
MSIFSIFKRKNEPHDGHGPVTGAAPDEGGIARPGDSDAERARQREIARATAAKIDAIESAMAHDIFNEPEPAWGKGRPARPPRPANGAPHDTLPMLELATTELLADELPPESPVQAETPPVVEEIAILYANAQIEIAEQMLLDSLADVGLVDRQVWFMLFDLYQSSGRQDDFDNIAIDYASRFETSPPPFTAPVVAKADQKNYAGVTPTEAFSGVLDDSIAPRLQRLLQQAATKAVFRLEFSRVQDVTPEGCAHLLAALKQLRKSGRELVVAGASELAETVRKTIEIGKRDASEAPWLLLLELLQVMNREKDFEETAMDYCVTYELSPPSFEMQANVAAAASERVPSGADRFMLPALIDGDIGPLLDAIEAYAKQYQPVVLDCSRLARVDYSAASQLQRRLRTLAGEDKKIELRDLNYLVAALFKLMGFQEVARIFPLKYS